MRVRAILPQEVKLTGKVFPEDARLTFDALSREIVWEVGDLKPGQGILIPGQTLAFQVSLTPVQAEQIFRLIGGAEISGKDDWTKAFLKTTTTAINTDF